MSNATSVIKINLVDEDNGVFERESWYGWGPFKATITDDDTLNISVPGESAQLVPAKSNNFGQYWVVKIAGGTALASVYNHEQYGTAVRLKLGEGVNLPEEVQAKLNKGGKPPQKKQYKNTKTKPWAK